MASCDECIHERLCVIKAFPEAFENTNWEKEPCDHFKSTEDVAEVKHGRWIKEGNEKKCFACKFIYYGNNDEWNYCPNCGAKMDGKQQKEG